MATEKPSRREALRITAVAGIGLALAGGAVAELVRRANLHRVSVTRNQLGTAVTVTVVHTDADEARAMVNGALNEIERLEGLYLAALDRSARPLLEQLFGERLQLSIGCAVRAEEVRRATKLTTQCGQHLLQGGNRHCKRGVRRFVGSNLAALTEIGNEPVHPLLAEGEVIEDRLLIHAQGTEHE